MERLSFEEPLRVAVAGPLDFLKGLQWEINKTATKKIELFQWRMGDQPVPPGLTAFVLFLEHGLTLPIQSLKAVSRIPCLCVFEVMNASQVTLLGQVISFRPLVWEEGRFDKICHSLLSDIEDSTASQGEGRIAGILKNWIREQGSVPSRVIWTNAPVTWTGPREITLPPGGAPLVVGSLESAADLKLPLSGKGEWAVLQRSKYGLQFRSLLPQLPVQFFGDPSQLKAGDRLKIFDFMFELASNPEFGVLKSFLRRYGISSTESEFADTGGKASRTLADTIRILLENGASGEIAVKYQSRVGYISILYGYIEDAIVGPVSGLKALFRLLSWPEVSSHFEKNERQSPASTSLRLGPLEFQKAYDRWKLRMSALKTLWPPLHLRVIPDPKAFSQKQSWGHKDFMVFAALAESERVFEVLNNCPLLDVEIVEGLVNLRKDSLFSIHA